MRQPGEKNRFPLFAINNRGLLINADGQRRRPWIASATSLEIAGQPLVGRFMRLLAYQDDQAECARFDRAFSKPISVTMGDQHAPIARSCNDFPALY
jgi:hypothetical protein